MKSVILFLSFFIITPAFAEYKFTGVNLGFGKVKNDVGDFEFKGDTRNLMLSCEMANQFVILVGTSHGTLKRTVGYVEYEIKSNQKAVGLGRYSKMSEGTKLYYYFATVDVDQTLDSPYFTRKLIYDITRGQKLGLSYIYDTPAQFDLSATVQGEDFGTYEEIGFGFSGNYHLDERLNVGLGVYQIEESRQVELNLSYLTNSPFGRAGPKVGVKGPDWRNRQEESDDASWKDI